MQSERIPNTCNVSILGQGFQGFRILARLKSTQASLGAACHADQQYSPSRILLALGIPHEVASNALRISVGRETSPRDIDVVVDDLQQSVSSLKKMSRKKKKKSDGRKNKCQNMLFVSLSLLKFLSTFQNTPC